ncbi:MAG: hypothetical protein DWQ04_09815 [Chloroflexi bacterium]|nr:MAG: hypothetical protein DWQ04_09815 [Chloroflexota bacterium]
MRKLILVILLILSLSFVLAACGGGDSGGDAADGGGPSVANGEKLFKQTVIGSASAPGCITCHSLEEGVVLVGPSHYDIAKRSEGVVPGMSVEEYIRQSIVEPNAHITEGYAEGVMYANYGTDIPAPNIDDIVAFMLTLQGE